MARRRTGWTGGYSTISLPPVRFLFERERPQPETGKHLLDRLFEAGLVTTASNLSK